MTKTVTELTAMTTAAEGDYIAMVDVSDLAQSVHGSTRKITVANVNAMSLPGAYRLGVAITAGVTATAACRTTPVSTLRGIGEWVVVDAYTTQAELCVIDAAGAADPVSGATFAYNHAVDDLVAPVPDKMLNVRLFGAKGDGVTDDTAAIQATISALTRGGTVWIPADIYQISATLTVPWRTELRGDGQYATTLRVASAIAGAVIRITDAGWNGWTAVRNLGITGAGLAGYGVEIEHDGVITVDSVRVDGCTYGIYVHNNVWTCVIRDCRVSLCTSGIALDATAGQVNHIIIERCTVASNDEYGILLIGGVANRIRCCDIESNDLGGVYQTGGISLTIESCYLERNGTTGAPTANILLGVALGTAVKNAVVTGNYIYGGKDGADPGECNYGVQVVVGLDALVQSNYGWGHILANATYAVGVTYTEQSNSWN